MQVLNTSKGTKRQIDIGESTIIVNIDFKSRPSIYLWQLLIGLNNCVSVFASFNGTSTFIKQKPFHNVSPIRSIPTSWLCKMVTRQILVRLWFLFFFLWPTIWQDTISKDMVVWPYDAESIVLTGREGMAGDSIFSGECGIRCLAHMSMANQEAKGLGKTPTSKKPSVTLLLMCVAHVNQLSHMCKEFYDLSEVSFHHH